MANLAEQREEMYRRAIELDCPSVVHAVHAYRKDMCSWEQAMTSTVVCLMEQNAKLMKVATGVQARSAPRMLLVPAKKEQRVMETVYVIPRALKDGRINQLRCEKGPLQDGRVWGRRDGSGWTSQHGCWYSKLDYSLTVQEAITRAEELRVKEIAILRAKIAEVQVQIVRLKALKFKVEE